MDLHFVDQNGNHFVVPDAPEGYERDDATLIHPPPTNEHRWIDGEWRIPEPSPTPIIYPQFTALEMLDLFTDDEQLAVVAATMTEPAVKLWYDRLIAATFVTYEDPRTEGGLQALVDAGLLDPGRKAEIVAAMQPETADT